MASGIIPKVQLAAVSVSQAGVEIKKIPVTQPEDLEPGMRMLSEGQR